ncbi:hypothetical protein B0H19DRAFT_1274344 [Mycena capillaripes]|nr:hypothetical protein B0H19DRAFT_1274344 [Mycena capillaripes]
MLIIGHMKVEMGVGVLLATFVQLFYAFRIYTLSKKSLMLPVIIGVLALADLALAIATVHKTFQVKYFSRASEDIPYFAGSLSLKVACDILIASAMVYRLLRNKTGFHKTSKAINLLVTYSLRSGAITMIFAICDLVAFLTLPSTLIYVPFFFVLVRLYALSFMSIEHLFSTTHAMITIPSSCTPDCSTLPADNDTRVTSTDTEIGKVPSSFFSSMGKEGPGSYPDML